MSQVEVAGELSPIKSPRLSWGQVLGLGSFAVAVGTVLLHLIGVVTHQVALRQWGVDADLFPKSADWLLIHGYYALLDRFVATIVAIQSEILWSLAAALAFSAYVAALLWVGDIDSPSWAAVTSRWPRWLQRFLRRSLLTLLLCLLLPACLLLLTVFVALPGAMGEFAGMSIASKQAADFAKGCSESKARCVELRRVQATTITGYILDSSPSHLAVYEVATRRAVTLPRDGVETHAVSAKK